MVGIFSSALHCAIQIEREREKEQETWTNRRPGYLCDMVVRMPTAPQRICADLAALLVLVFALGLKCAAQRAAVGEFQGGVIDTLGGFVCLCVCVRLI